jgi:predicted RNA-binding Zn ribbon-like protein
MMNIELLQLGEPLTVELVNSLYVDGDDRYDVLIEHPEAWLQALDLVVPDDLCALRRLRDAIRSLVHAQVDGTPAPERSLWLINDSARTPPAQQLQRVDGRWAVVTEAPHDDASLRGFLAAEAIELLATRGEGLRRCAAPDCGLVFFQQHRRRRFCQHTCSGRTRQAAYLGRHRE